MREVGLARFLRSNMGVVFRSFAARRTVCAMRGQVGRARLILVLALVAAADAARKGVPHAHQGKLNPFVPGLPTVKLTSGDRAKLENGDMIVQQVQDKAVAGGRATAVQLIHAPPKVIWDQLLDLNSYSKKVGKLSECAKYYEKSTMPPGSKQIKARFLVNAAPGFNYEYYCDHAYVPSKQSLTWTLDYTKDSDFDDVCGHWYVAPHKTAKGDDWSAVYYSADIALKGYVPGFVMNVLTGSALKSAVGWVKKHSEADWAAQKARLGGGGCSGSRAGKKLLRSWSGLAGLLGHSPVAAPLPPPLAPVLPFYRRPRLLAAAGMSGAVAAASVIVAQHNAQPKEAGQ